MLRRGRLRNLALGMAASLVLASCSEWKVGPDYRRPAVAVPKNWRFASDLVRHTTHLAWWRQWGDPVLNRLIEQAFSGNLDLAMAVARVDEFMGRYGATRSNLFPQISGFGEYAGRKVSSRTFLLPDGIEFNNTPQEYARLGAQMNWEIDVWGQLRRANEAAFADMLGYEHVKRGVILTLAADVATTYIQLRSLDKSLAITRQVVGTLEEQRRIEEARFREGFTSQLAVSQVNSEYERRAALIPKIEEAIARAEHALTFLLGRNPGGIARGRSLDQLTLPAVPKGLPSDLLTRRPDIDAAEQALIAANARIGVARGQYFPRIGLTGDVGQLSAEAASLFTPGANFWTIGVNALGPIFTAGRIAGQVQAAEAVQRQALANYQRAILAAFREFEDALVAFQKTQAQQTREAARVDAVHNYYRLSQLQYDEGMVDYITVLDSLRQLFEAQISLLDAQSATYIAAIQLYRAMGGGWIVAEESEKRILQPPDAPLVP